MEQPVRKLRVPSPVAGTEGPGAEGRKGSQPQTRDGTTGPRGPTRGRWQSSGLCVDVPAGEAGQQSSSLPPPPPAAVPEDGSPAWGSHAGGGINTGSYLYRIRFCARAKPLKWKLTASSENRKQCSEPHPCSSLSCCPLSKLSSITSQSRDPGDSPACGLCIFRDSCSQRAQSCPLTTGFISQASTPACQEEEVQAKRGLGLGDPVPTQQSPPARTRPRPPVKAFTSEALACAHQVPHPQDTPLHTAGPGSTLNNPAGSPHLPWSCLLAGSGHVPKLPLRASDFLSNCCPGRRKKLSLAPALPGRHVPLVPGNRAEATRPVGDGPACSSRGWPGHLRCHSCGSGPVQPGPGLGRAGWALGPACSAA